MIELRETSPESIPEIVRRARREGLLMAGTETLYGAYIGGELVGICGLKINGRRALMKSSYVEPEHRSRGVFREMIRRRLREALASGASVAEANCLPASLRTYLGLGFAEVQRYKNGVTKVRRELVRGRP